MRKPLTDDLIAVRDRHRCAACRAHFGESSDRIGGEHDYAIPVPGATAPVGSIADGLDILSVCINALQLAIGEKADAASVLGPERILHSCRSFQWRAFWRIEVPHPDKNPALRIGGHIGNRLPSFESTKLPSSPSSP